LPIVHRVAVGGLDLDDLGAEVGQQPAAKRTRHRGPHFEHANARERPVTRACCLIDHD
jgi:hypothetical protein